MPEPAAVSARRATAPRRLGAIVSAAGTAFRVWAPDRERVDLVLDRDVRPLARDGRGYWSGTFADITAGTRYRYRLDGRADLTFPDPASRFQPDGVHGPSQVVDPATYRWQDAGFAPAPFDALTIYELHVGTFTPGGTFRGAIARLPDLAALGVTAIELMPVGDFPGRRNWGYDGVAIFAPARCYGTPDDLRALVDAAHGHGLAVWLDVVYNHFGPDGAYANAFSSHYFTDRHRSPWGDGVNLDGDHAAEVRRFFIENALQWIDDFHVDGLRLDATHALQDDSGRHFLAELSEAVHTTAGRPVWLVAEDHRNLAALVTPRAHGGLGIDGVWADDFHHQARVHTAHDREGYYQDFSGSTADVAATLRQGWFFTGQRSAHLDEPRGTDPSPLLPRQFIICIQNHDQVGNRADGARLHHEIDPAAWRALSALLLLAPQTPLLFMGQEWAASAPFLFFTDHHEELGRLVTDGRRAEFGAFAAFADPARRTAIPDPQADATFARSRLDWSERAHAPHAHTLRLYTALLALRRATLAGPRPRGSYDVRALDAHTVVLDYPRLPLRLVVRLSGAGTVGLDAGNGMPAPPTIALSTEDARFAADPQPIAVDGGGPMTQIRFARPGALVLSS